MPTTTTTTPSRLLACADALLAHSERVGPGNDLPGLRGFTTAEVKAAAVYLHRAGCIELATVTDDEAGPFVPDPAMQETTFRQFAGFLAWWCGRVFRRRGSV